MTKKLYSQRNNYSSIDRNIVEKSFLFTFRILVFVFLLLSFNSEVHAEETVTVQNHQGIFLKGARLDHFEDSQSTLTFSQIRKLEKTFRSLKQGVPNFGYTRSAHWFRFTARGADDLQEKHLIVINYSLLDQVHFYSPDEEGTYSEIKEGQMYSFPDRKIKSKNFLFPLNLKAGQLRTYYLRVATRDSLSLPVKIVPATVYLQTSNSEHLVLGILFGFLIIMILYNLFLFLSTQERNYILFVFYIISFVMFASSENGLALQYLWPRSPWWGKHVVPLSVGLVELFSSLFVRSFLKTKERTPRLDLFFKIYHVIGMVNVLVALTAPYFFSIIFAVLSIVVYAPAILGTGFLIWRKGHRSGRFFLIAWTALSAGALIYALKALGFLPEHLLTRNGVLLGASIQVTFLSLGLADQFNILNSMLQQSNIESEQKRNHLFRIMEKAKYVSEELLKAGHEQSEIAYSYAGLASDQAALSEEMSAIYEQLSASNQHIDTSMTNHVREGKNSLRMVEILSNSQKEVKESNAAVIEDIQKMLKATEKTRNDMLELSKMMNIIDQGGQKISNVMDIINDITEKINMLSLNASIEAARAGEHGRGFAVVAEEISKLANATSANSGEISKQVASILHDMAESNSLMNNAQDSNNTVSSLSGNINLRIQNAVNAIKRQEDAVQSVMQQTGAIEKYSRIIATSTTEQKNAMEESVDTVERLTVMAQEISSNSEIILEITRKINEKADELQGSIALDDTAEASHYLYTVPDSA